MMIINDFFLKRAIEINKTIDSFVHKKITKKYGYINYDYQITNFNENLYNVMVYKNYGEANTNTGGSSYLFSFDFCLKDIKNFISEENVI